MTQPSYSEFAVRLRDAAADALRTTAGFWHDITIDEVALNGPSDDPDLVVTLHPTDFPSRVYGLRTSVRDFEESNGPPEEWKLYLRDAVMEAVDADPGLPSAGNDDGTITWLEF